MPPRKIAPVEVESFAVKKRSYVRKKKVEAEPEPPISEMEALSLNAEPLVPEAPEAPEPPPKKVATQASALVEKARFFVPWSSMDWDAELEPKERIYITCRVAIPFVGKNMMNIQFYTKDAMNPMGAFCLPYTTFLAPKVAGESPSTPPESLPQEASDPTESFYTSFLNDRVMVRYEIYRHETDLSWKMMKHPEKKKSEPGYHGSVFLMREPARNVSYEPKFVILYKDQYVQLPRLMLRGVFQF